MKIVAQVLQDSPFHWVGNGFPVRSIFDYNGPGRVLSPFLLMDYAAPYDFPPGESRRGVGVHPHKGFETVTIVYQGELEHRDSTGAGGVIGPGDVQWMTAGRGILHEEFHSPNFTRTGGKLEMVQLWVNLRSSDKNQAPRYQTLKAGSIPSVDLADGCGKARIIAGRFGRICGPAETFSPVNLWDLSFDSPADVELQVSESHTAALLILQGDGVFPDGRSVSAGDFVVFSREGRSIEWQAPAGAKYLFLSGEPLEEPVVGRGPFVMNTSREIDLAFSEFQEGKFGKLSE
jgi:redox-sensitive bicupin YhaK (pirin superfamily)